MVGSQEAKKWVEKAAWEIERKVQRGAWDSLGKLSPRQEEAQNSIVELKNRVQRYMEIDPSSVAEKLARDFNEVLDWQKGERLMSLSELQAYDKWHAGMFEAVCKKKNPQDMMGGMDTVDEIVQARERDMLIKIKKIKEMESKPDNTQSRFYDKWMRRYAVYFGTKTYEKFITYQLRRLE